MIVKAWNNGAYHVDGNGYGIKITSTDRDQFFNPEWATIFLILDGKPEIVEININKKSFWNETCRELISKEIGKWLIENQLGQWPPRQPPKLELNKVGERKFLLKVLDQRRM